MKHCKMVGSMSPASPLQHVVTSPSHRASETTSWRLLRDIAAGESFDAMNVDWPQLLACAAGEGMLGLLARAATQCSTSNAIPLEVQRQLRIALIQLEARTATMLAELARIAETFRSAGIRLLTAKGAVTSQQLYGDPSLRAFTDLDLFVHPADSQRGAALLQSCSYREAEPHGAAESASYARFNYATGWVHDRAGIAVDFHWHFSGAQFPIRFTFDDVWMRRRSVQVGAHELDTFGDIDCVLFTASHAAKHLWSRLEFLAQLSALAKQPLDWEAVDARAIETNVARQLACSFRLAHDWLGTPLPPLPRSFARARRAYPAVRSRVMQNFASTPRASDATGRDHLLLLDRNRDVIRSLSVALFVPTHTDWRAARRPFFAWLNRPLRLLWARRAWLSA
jgi:hypothetical protein